MSSHSFHLISIILFGGLVPVAGAGVVIRKRAMDIATFSGIVAGIILLSSTLYSRWIEVAHPPFQTLYEVYITIALSIGAGYFLINLTGFERGEGRIFTLLYRTFRFLVILSIFGILLYGYLSHDYGTELPPALKSPWFVPHVVVYLFGYGSLILAFCSSVAFLILYQRAGGDARVVNSLDEFTYRVISLGFPFLSAGLIFGAIWAFEAWATYWGWDSKEVWSLITWLAYLIYLHQRFVKGWRGKRAAILVILGTAAIFVTLILFGYMPASMTSLHKY